MPNLQSDTTPPRLPTQPNQATKELLAAMNRLNDHAATIRNYTGWLLAIAALPVVLAGIWLIIQFIAAYNAHLDSFKP